MPVRLVSKLFWSSMNSKAGMVELARQVLNRQSPPQYKNS